MTVQNIGAFIFVDFKRNMLTRAEALQLIEDLTEAVRMCPVNPNAAGQTPAAHKETV
jgi:hypothetical protein